MTARKKRTRDTEQPGASEVGPVRFGLLGAAGYIANRHMKAVRDNGCELVAAHDPSDSVGILDSYFPNCSFYPQTAGFWKACKERQAQWITICTPNYLHVYQAVEAMRCGYGVVCEKPLCIDPGHLKTLQAVQEETGMELCAIQQMRLHPSAIQLKEDVARHEDQRFWGELEYVTRRGLWYWESWKADKDRSGGLLMNIGVHLFDLLIWVFGDVQGYEIERLSPGTYAGFLELDKATISWKLSIEEGQLPKHLEGTTYRHMNIKTDNGYHHEFDFTTGFEDLHTQSYSKILSGDGFHVDDVRHGIELVHRMTVR